MALDFSFACDDWVDRLKAGALPIPDLPIDMALVRGPLQCFDQLRLPDVIGQPTFGEAGAEWFREIIATLYGYVDPQTKVRLISELFLLVPKKNGKSTNTAALAVMTLLMNEIPNAAMLVLGATQSIAETCFDQAVRMIKLDPKLSAILHVKEGEGRIDNLLSGAFLEIKTFGANVITGDIPVFTIVDEYHLLHSKKFAKKVMVQIRGGMTKANSLLVIITTQSTDEPAGVFLTDLTYAREIRDGKKESTDMLPILYEFPESMQLDEEKPWMNPDVWPMILPNLGRSITIEFLKTGFKKANDKGAEDIQIWLSQHLNIQIGVGLHANRWIGVDYWVVTGDKELTLERIMELSDVCVVGVDGGGLDDLLGFAVIGRHKTTRDWMHWGKAWAQPEALQQRPEIVARLKDFRKAGDLVICAEVGQDIFELTEYCRDLNDAGLFPEVGAVGMDPEGIVDILDALIECGLTIEQIVSVSQGYRLNAAVNGLPRKLKNKTFSHCAQPLMAWTVGNCKTELVGNARKVTKQVSGVGKIDPAMAMFDAAMLMSRNPVSQVTNVISIPADYRVA